MAYLTRNVLKLAKPLTSQVLKMAYTCDHSFLPHLTVIKEMKVLESSIEDKRKLLDFLYLTGNQNYMTFANLQGDDSTLMNLRCVLLESHVISNMHLYLQPLYRLSKISEIWINFERMLVPQITKDIRFTFSDKLTTFGGTLVLFTGLSIISLVEILFWTGRAIRGLGS